MLILLDSLPLLKNQMETAETPFGTVTYSALEVNGETVLVIYRPPAINPKSLAYAARSLGGSRVIGLIRDSQVERPFTPADYIEFTSGRPTTFYETVGTGYVQQNPPFCPELRQATVAAGAAPTGTLLIVDTLPDPGVRSWWHAHQISLISTATQPEGALCRELELCYAVVALPATVQLTTMLPDILANLPDERHCNCGQLMATARKFGKLTADWFENLNESTSF